MDFSWTPIYSIAGMIERQFGRSFDGALVEGIVRGHRDINKAWGPGGRTLMASTRAMLSDYRNDEAA